MARNIKLNSNDWIDLVFENKNKAYGAYKLRQTSAKRHVLAFGVTVLFVGSIIAIPAFLEAVKPERLALDGLNDAPRVIGAEEKEEKDEKITPPEELQPPKPPVKATIVFNPPLIEDDDKVSDKDVMKDAKDLIDSKNEISNVDNPNGSHDKDAISPDEALKNNDLVAPPKENKPEPPFKVVEIMPTPQGGHGELMRFLSSNIRYPSSASDNGIEGKVILNFVVERDGSITGIKVVKTLDPSCDKEAMRVVKLMPNWVPGRQGNKAVRVEFTLPVTFKLQK